MRLVVSIVSALAGPMDASRSLYGCRSDPSECAGRDLGFPKRDGCRLVVVVVSSTSVSLWLQIRASNSSSSQRVSINENGATREETTGKSRNSSERVSERGLIRALGSQATRRKGGQKDKFVC